MTKMHIHILIQDTNLYFAQGLTTLLQDNFICRKINAVFLTRDQAHLADLLILSNEMSQLMWAYFATPTPFRQTVLVIQNTHRQHALPRYLHTAGIIRRCDTKETTLQRIEAASSQSLPSYEETPDEPLTLTPREYQILSLTGQGVLPYEIAKQLKLHIKTVSTHKCSAMRKLGFSRNHDLYRWLRYGGLVNSLASDRYKEAWAARSK